MSFNRPDSFFTEQEAANRQSELVIRRNDNEHPQKAFLELHDPKVIEKVVALTVSSFAERRSGKSECYYRLYETEKVFQRQILFHYLTAIRKLEFVNCSLSDDSLVQIASFAKESVTLRHLKCGSTNTVICDRIANAFFCPLQESKLVSLEVSLISMDAAVLGAICHLITHTKSILSLKLTKVGGLYQNVTGIFTSLSNSQLIHTFAIEYLRNIPSPVPGKFLRDLILQRTIRRLSITSSDGARFGPFFIQTKEENTDLRSIIRESRFIRELNIGYYLSESAQLRRNAQIEHQVNLDTFSLIRYCRTLALSRPRNTDRYRIPMEIMIHIASQGYLSRFSQQGPPDRKIVRALTNRLTIGMIHDGDLEFCMPTFRFLCVRVLGELLKI